MDRELSLAWHTTKSMIDATCSHLPNIVIGIIVCFIFLKLAGTLRKVIMRVADHAKLDITLAQALGSLSSAGLILLGVLITATIIVPGFKPSHIIAGLGLTSVALGLASKDIVENFFSGLLLLWQKPFRIGDAIKTGEFEGTVEEMRIKSTRLRTDDGELVIIPNASISSNPITVKTAFKTKRSELTIAGSPNRSIEANRKMIKQIIDSTETVAKSPTPEILLVDIGSGNQTFKILFWTDSSPLAVAQTIDKLNSRIRDTIYQSTPHA